MAAMQQHRPQQMPMQPPQQSPVPSGPGQQGGQQTPNPSHKIPFPLLPHVHLKSHQFYPLQSRVSFAQIVQHLKEAPRVVRDLQPVEWTYVDPPRDGTTFLVYQGPGHIQFASDGYYWGDAETHETLKHENYNVDVFKQKCGYLPGETVATHARHRYRLTPNGPPNVAPCDPCLWIVRYFRAPPEQQMPVSQIVRVPVMAQILYQRAQIEKAGRLVRKTFMLNDVANWPTLQVPEHLLRLQRGSTAAADEHVAKRMRQDDGKDHDEVLEMIEINPPPGEDDDKDIFDILTPRDISIHRYTRHNEWMEELMVSPYALSDIRKVTLGMGRGGGLRKLTKQFYAPALDEKYIRQPDRYTGGDDAAKEYTKDDVDAYEAENKAFIDKTRKEMAESEKAHEKALAQLREKGPFLEAESRLRYALHHETEDPLEIEAASHFKDAVGRRRQPERIDDIVHEVTSKLSQTTKTQPNFRQVSRGGYQTPPPPPSPPAEEEEEEEEPEPDTEMGEDDEGDEDGFVDFDEADPAGTGLSDQPHPDAQPAQPAEGEDGWVVLGKESSQAGSASNGGSQQLATATVAEPPASTTAAAPANIAAPSDAPAPADATTPAEADPTEDMLDFGADSAANGTPAEGLDGDGADFGASLDFGDLPEDDAGQGNAGGDAMESAFTDAMAPRDEVPAPAPIERKLADLGSGELEAAAGSGSGSGSGSGLGDVEMEMEMEMDMDVGGEGEGEGKGEGEGPGEAPVDFDDSAFGDAFHHTEFEAED